MLHWQSRLECVPIQVGFCRNFMTAKPQHPANPDVDEVLRLTKVCLVIRYHVGIRGVHRKSRQHL